MRRRTRSDRRRTAYPPTHRRPAPSLAAMVALTAIPFAAVALLSYPAFAAGLLVGAAVATAAGVARRRD
ncbi:hypothetical protein [Halegenticoccus soli]|uniref:hypothetical protein n=1 Tax=Halegenticoccus soli TaxID=1985678 RepID=UPI00117A73B9|nr:hypothetical protein [Halegenticoccus soli]